MANKKKDVNKKTGYEKDKVKEVELDLLFMSPSDITARDIADFLKENSSIRVEIWEAMNVLEIELANQNSIDFEPLDINFQNPSDASFVKNRNIKTIFSIRIVESDLDMIKSLFEQIINQYSGFLCSDTDDFNPVYVGTSAR